MKFTVDMQTYANATIDVELSDEKLAEIAVECEKDVKDLTLDDMRESVEDKAFMQGVPGICAQCSGWGAKHSLDISSDWEIVDDSDVTVDRFKSIRIKE